MTKSEITINDASQKRTAFCAVTGLACMFGGIWISDNKLLPATNLGASVIAMRLSSLLVYLFFFVLSLCFVKYRRNSIEALFGVSSVIGLVLFGVGSTVILEVLPRFSPTDLDAQVVALVALLLAKMIGGPVSVGMVCVFALLNRSVVMRTCALGMLGAFVWYSGLLQIGQAGVLDDRGLVMAAGILLFVSLMCGMLGMGQGPRRSERQITSSSAALDALIVPGVVKRPFGKVMTPGFVIMVVFSAIMLGFLRNGMTGTDPHANPFSLAALLVLFAVAALWNGMRTEYVFYSALFCTTAGILLSPLLDFVLPDASLFLYGLGTSLFEVIMWSFVVWGARNCTDTLMAAAGGRLVAVCGHLAGTMMVTVGFLVASSPAKAQHVGALIIVFAYVILLMVLLRFPQLQAPFLSPVDEFGLMGSVNLPHNYKKSDRFSESEYLPSETPDQFGWRYWKEPCTTIAHTYQLTVREQEILEFMAHGRDMPFMEKKLCISRNTIKMHIRHIYTKLDIHSKQEIIDMMEQVHC